MKILLAEDDNNIVIVIRMTLEKLSGHTVTHVENGLKALEEAIKTEYDLILLDSMMPGKDGLTVCRELKDNHHVNTPIIFLSAKSQDQDIQACIQAGAIGYIQKPFDPMQINAEIIGLLKKQDVAA